MKKLLFALTILIPVVAFAAKGTMTGAGTEANPWQIADYEDLKAIGTGPYLYSNHYVLTKDIDASASKHEMCGSDGSCNGFITIGKKKDAVDSMAFHGSFDGKNHTIKNLNIWLPCESNVGFIYRLYGTLSNLKFDSLNITGRVSESDFVGVVARSFGSIKNVHVTNGFVQGENYVGGIAGDAVNPLGYSDKSLLDSVSFQGTVRGRNCVGGIVGDADGIITNAKADVHVIATFASGDKAPQYYGGVAGSLDGNMLYCSATGMMSVDATIDRAYVDNVGGLVGENNGSISWSYARMDIKGLTQETTPTSVTYTTGFDGNVGGLVGRNKGEVFRSYFIGNVNGRDDVGGVVGYNSGRILYTYSLGSVSGETGVGGIVGLNMGDDSSIEYSYTITTVQGTERVGSIVGGPANSNVVGSYWNKDYTSGTAEDLGDGLTSAQMKSLANFDGWADLEDEFTLAKIWNVDEGMSYPYLNLSSLEGFSTATPVLTALPTSASAWQEEPVVAAKEDVEYPLVGKWQNWFGLNSSGDSIYYNYVIGYLDGADTVWGTSSYMAVPNKIEIATLADLEKIGNVPSYPLIANYELTADIDGLNSNFKPIGDSVAAFMGQFNGNDHTISNLNVGGPNRDFSGLFSYAVNASIENLVLKNIHAEGSWFVGTLAGEARQSGIRNVVSHNGEVDGVDYVGGLVGNTYKVQMEKVGTTGKVTGHEYVGGIAGYMDYGSLEKAFSMNVVKGTKFIGGIAGFLYDSFTLKEAYSASLLKGRDYRYGFGYMGSSVKEPLCYYDSTLFAEYRDTTGRTTEQMLKQSNYVDWDFENTWAIDEGKSYPYFKGLEPMLPGTLEDDGTLFALLGSGTENDPYQIETYDDLELIGKAEYTTDLHYMLVDSINASWYSPMEDCNADSTICKGFEPIANFSGTFLGNGFKIKGLVINRADEDTVGLFKSLTATAKVSKLRLDSVVVNGKKYVGGLAGVDLGADIDSVSVRAFINAQDYAGAIAGEKIGGSLEIGESEGEITAKNYAGGLFGNLKNATLKNTFSMAFVTGESVLGGLVGNSDGATVANSIAIGKVSGGDKVGSLAGSANKSTWTSAYCDSTLWHQHYTAGGEMKNSAEMVYKSTYEDWDFDNVWKISEGLTYPRLLWGKGNLPLIFGLEISVMQGSGTEADPFQVKTLQDLRSIGSGHYALSSVYRLMNDIEVELVEDYSNKNELYAIGTNSTYAIYGRGFESFGPGFVSGAFSGAFHGGGHTISNLRVVSDSFYSGSDDFVFINVIAETGLVDSLSFKNLYSFGDGKSGFTAQNRGTIRHVSVEGVFGRQAEGNLVGGEMAAGIATVNLGIISDCFVEGSVGANHVAGGIVAENWGVVENCSTSVELVGQIYAGGLVGIDHGTLKNSKALGTASSNGIVGGAVGFADGATIDSVEANVLVTQTWSPLANDSAGGFVGKNNGHISNSVALGEIENGCGFAGTNESSGVIGTSYATGIVSDGSGFVGINKGTIRDSYSTGEVRIKNSYDRNFGGFAGQNIDGGKIMDVYSTGAVVFYGDPKMPLAAYNVNPLVGDQAATISNAYTLGWVKAGDQMVCALNSWQKDGSNVYFNSDKCSMPDSVSGLALLTDNQMHYAKNFKNFNFEKTWAIDDGRSYPILRFHPESALVDDADDLSDTTDVKDTTVTADSSKAEKDEPGEKETAKDKDVKDDSSKNKDSKGEKESISGSSVVVCSMLKAVVNGNFAELQFRTTVDGLVKFSLMDMQGRIVASKNLGKLSAGGYTRTLDLANLRNGGYVGVLLVNNRVVERTRLLKK